MCPRRIVSIWGKNACSTHICANIFTSNILRISSALWLNNEWHGIMPALFTTTVTLPTSVRILLAKARTLSRFVTSHLEKQNMKIATLFSGQYFLNNNVEKCEDNEKRTINTNVYSYAFPSCNSFASRTVSELFCLFKSTQMTVQPRATYWRANSFPIPWPVPVIYNLLVHISNTIIIHFFIMEITDFVWLLGGYTYQDDFFAHIFIFCSNE